MSNGSNSDLWSEIKHLKSVLWERYKREELEWLQKSRLKWFKDGDKNTKYFHLVASLRNSHSIITSLRLGDTVVIDQNLISVTFEEYFRKSFNEAKGIPIKDLGVVLPKLSEDSTKLLEARFYIDEEWSAIQSADGSHAPGPDGFNLDFYKRFWQALKGNRAVIIFVQTCVAQRSVTGTWIAPEVGFVKFNVDATVKGSIGATGIGAVLRDHNVKVLFRFSKSIGISDPTCAELYGILEAYSLFASSPWVDVRSLIIEPDSKPAVGWIKGPLQAPTCFIDMVGKCKSYVDKFNWTIIFVFREGNVEAHHLVKQGIDRTLEYSVSLVNNWMFTLVLGSFWSMLCDCGMFQTGDGGRAARCARGNQLLMKPNNIYVVFWL
ncbi:hypothetical protein GQ457_11G021500 [Hibiscus cannabinus]